MYSRIIGLFAISLITIGVFSACSDDNNIVGSSFIPSDRDIVIDTLDITNLSIQQLVSFTGNLSHFTAGIYQDEIYGLTQSSAFLAPGINTRSAADTMHAGAEVFLVLHPHNFYGDTTSTAVFDLHYITERWRPNDADVSTQVVTDPVSLGMIEVTAETDSVLFQLPQEWADNYRELFHETDNPIENLRANEFGFALIPRDQTNVLVGFNTQSLREDTLGNSLLTGSRLFVANPPGSAEDEDEENGTASFPLDNGQFEGRSTFSVAFRGNAFNINRETNSTQEGILPLLNTFEQTLRLDLDLADRDFSEQVISRAELVFFDNLPAQENLPGGHYRPSSGRLLYYTLTETEQEFEVIKLPIFEPPMRENDQSYRVNVTNFIRNFQLGENQDVQLFINSGSNNGLITPRVLVGPAAGERSPKLIITRINPEN